MTSPDPVPGGTGASRAGGGLGRDEAVALLGLASILAVTCAWWALALWPVADAPAWLERTRYVCFGVAETGLPDAAGWTGLVGGPAGMLAILVVGLWSGMKGLLVRARRPGAVSAALAAMLLTVVLLGAFATTRVRAAAAAETWADEPVLAAADHPRLDWAAPPLELTGHDGSAVRLAERTRPVILTFAFGHCATVCPMVVSDARQAQLALRAEGIEADVFVVTLDPWRDTPGMLAGLAERWILEAPGGMVLGGSVDDVERTLDAWRVPRTRDTTTGDVTHPALTYIVDPGSDTVVFASTGDGATLAALVKRL